MLTVPATTRIYLVSHPIDMRKGFDGLCAIIADKWKHDPFSGHVFVFVGKRRDRIKVLFWDQSGFALYYKRLEKGRFQMPDTSGRNVRLEPTELAMLLSGIDLNRPRLKRWQPSQTAIDNPR